MNMKAAIGMLLLAACLALAGVAKPESIELQLFHWQVERDIKAAGTDIEYIRNNLSIDAPDAALLKGPGRLVIPESQVDEIAIRNCKKDAASDTFTCDIVRRPSMKWFQWKGQPDALTGAAK